MLPAWKRDYWAGGLVALIGAYAIVQAQTYRVGELTRMGPGFFPAVIGAALALVGLLIAGTALASREPDAHVEAPPEWRGWLCVIGGPILFVLLGKSFGLAPATFACVFVAALGDRSATLLGSALLAAGVTVFGVALFVYVLHVQFPVLRWPNV